MRRDLEPIWDAVREELRRETPAFKFHIWLEPLELAGVDGRVLYVRAPEHIRTVVGERFLGLLRRAAARRFDEHAVVHVVGESWQPSERAEPAPDAESGHGDRSGALNPKYTFDQFVIGDGNRFAHAAALAVAELPGQAYNPVFMHGPPGVGKTHLLHAVGNYVRRFGSALRVRYATVEEFTSEFVEAVREGRTPEFKERFRRSDVVLIDDLQFLARKERTREEFFHTFNALIESGRQLVLTSDRSPDELPDLERRLAERFRAGLVVDLSVPGPEVRRAILQKRARLDGLDVDPDVLDEIAGRVASSVRALEGALIRVVAYASMRGETPTPELARQLLDRLGDDITPRCGIPEILDATAGHFELERKQLLARSRRPGVAEARQVAMYLARELTPHSLPEIGRTMGGRNHTTVLHAVNKVGEALSSDPALRSAVNAVKQQLGRTT